MCAAEILGNSRDLHWWWKLSSYILGTAGSSLWSVHSACIHAETCGAGKRLSILPWPVCWWVCSWWRVKKRLFSLVLWLFAMEGSFCGGGQNLKSRFAWAPVVVLTLLHCAVASTLWRPEWQCGPWMILGTQAVPVNLQAYKTASWVICTKKKRSWFKNKRNTWTWFIFTFYLVFKLACSFKIYLYHGHGDFSL